MSRFYFGGGREWGLGKAACTETADLANVAICNEPEGSQSFQNIGIPGSFPVAGKASDVNVTKGRQRVWTGVANESFYEQCRRSFPDFIYPAKLSDCARNISSFSNASSNANRFHFIGHFEACNVALWQEAMLNRSAYSLYPVLTWEKPAKKHWSHCSRACRPTESWA